MNDKKHIDRLFQEKFKDFEVTPDPAVWNIIHNALHKDKRKRRVIPFWWKTAGIAALLMLLFTVGNSVFNKDNELSNPKTEVVGNDNTQSPSEPNKSSTIKENRNSTIIDNSNTIATADQSEAAGVDSENDSQKKTLSTRDKFTTQTANEKSGRRYTTTSNSQENVNSSKTDNTGHLNSKEEAIAKNTSNIPQLNSDQEVSEQSNKRLKTILKIEKEGSKIAEVTSQNKIKDTETLTPDVVIIASNKEESIEEAIAKANTINEEEKEAKPSRWNITPNVAPVYFNTLGKGSTIHSQFVNNTKSGEVNMSYGISGSYAVSDKIKIRAGINKVNLGYSTDGVIAFSDINSFNGAPGNAELQNINFKNQSSKNAYLSSSSINVASAPQLLVLNSSGALEQQFGYIEVPLELEYNIINTKFGLNVIGGFSTLFLNNNEIFSVLENQRSLLGEANNINRTSYSANFGLGFNYNVSSTLKLNLEPMFKYQIHTFNNTSGDFRPYFIGVYTGFSFKF